MGVEKITTQREKEIAKRKEEIDYTEVRIYHGSLAELNSRDSNQQYKFANDGSVRVSNRYFARPNIVSENVGPESSPAIEEVLESVPYGWKIQRKLWEQGFHGVVNARTQVIYPFVTDSEYCEVVEGTPIVKVIN